MSTKRGSSKGGKSTTSSSATGGSTPGSPTKSKKKAASRTELEALAIENACDIVSDELLDEILIGQVHSFDVELHNDARRRRPLKVVSAPILPLPSVMTRLPLPSLRPAENAEHEEHQIHTHFHLHHGGKTKAATGSREVASLLSGMPGKLGMPAEVAERYFGPHARDNFFEHMRWVDHQRKISAEKPGQTLTSFAFASNTTVRTQPFEPSLPSLPDAPMEGFGFGGGSMADSVSLSGGGGMTLPAFSRSIDSVAGATVGSVQVGTGILDRLASEMAFSVHRPVQTDPLAASHAAIQLAQLRDVADWSVDAGTSMAANTELLTDDVEESHRKNAMHAHGRTGGEKVSKIAVKRGLANSKTLDPQIARIIRIHEPSGLDKRGRRKPIEIPATVHPPGWIRPTREEWRSTLLASTTNMPHPCLKGDRDKATHSSSPPHFSSRHPVGSLDDMEFDDSILEIPIVVPEMDDDELASVMLNSRLMREGAIFESLPLLSPRSTYLAGCLRDKLNPRAIMMVRKTFTKILDLRNQSIGDKLGVILAESVQRMPFLESLNLADNRLTDASLAPLLKALVKIESLLSLDLSYNKLDEASSTTLAAYLGRASCPLQSLILRNADVDDGEGATFIKVLAGNNQSRLRELDLSSNLLGNAEQMTVLDPNLTTTGQAFAALFSSPFCSLQKVLVGWNMIRLNSATVLAQSLRTNHSVVELDLSCNSLSIAGGLALAASLMANGSIQYLNVANNAIDGMACFALCAAICENKVLRRVVFDDNPIGVLGSKALMQVPTVVGSRVTLSARQCNLSLTINPNLITDGSKPDFDFDNLIREYTLTLSRAYDRAVAIYLLNIVACHHTLIFSTFEYDASPTGTGKFEALELVQYLHSDKEQHFNLEQREVKESLEELIAACSDKNLAIELFNDVDEDGSGELEIDEFETLLNSIGFEVDDEQLEELFDTYDVNSRGSIILSEFLVFLRRQHKDVIKRLQDHLHTPAYVQKKDAKLLKGGKVDPNTPKYVPPSVGRLRIAIVDGFAKKEIFRTLTNSEKQFIASVAASTNDAASMVSHGVSSAKLRLDEAVALYAEMSNESRDKAKMLSKLLPQLAYPEDARLLVNKALRGDKLELAKVRQTIGPALRPLMGMFGGFYYLDLSQPLDRLCLMRLLEISSTRSDTLRAECKVPVPGFSADFSQKHNDNSCFRNEVFEGKLITLTPAFAQPMPKTGILFFDYSVGGGRPSDDVMIASDQRVVKSLHSLFLLPGSQVENALQRLEDMQEISSKCSGGSGLTTYECSWQRAIDTSIAKIAFHKEILERADTLQEWMYDMETVTQVFDSPSAIEAAACMTHDEICASVCGKDFNVLDEPSSFESNKGSYWTLEAAKRDAEKLRKAQLKRALRLRYSTPTEDGDTNARETSSVSASDAATASDAAAATEGRVVPKLVEEGGQDYYTKKLRLLLLNDDVSDLAKAAKLVDAVDGIFSHFWLLCRHLALICQCFGHLGSQQRGGTFGTYRSEVVVLLFERLVDVENFDLVLRLLEPIEIAAVTARVGWLNFFNPLKPEGSIELNLAHYEERLIMKMLNSLSVGEPGDSWPAKQFKWKYEDDCIPGWELTTTWMTNEGVPERGFATIQFYSGGGNCARGCRPIINLRKALLHLTFTCREEDLTRSWDSSGGGSDGGNGEVNTTYNNVTPTMTSSSSYGTAGDAATLVGVRFIKNNADSWLRYLLAI